MPRKPGHVPAYRLHKASGQARVIVAGDHIYLGPYGSQKSQEEYARIVAKLSAGSPKPAAAAPPPICGELSTIGEILVAYIKFAETYYVKDGVVTKEFTSMKLAMRPLRHLHSRTLARDFGPKALKEVRQRMIELGWSRGVTNHNVNRIKRIFRWAVEEELIPSSVLHGLQAVRGLQFGRTEARETEPVKPVPDTWADIVQQHVSPQIAAMIKLQRLTGMRPCEVVMMRSCDIDLTGQNWIYEPHDHKNRWRGHRRLIPLGPKAQKIVKQFLKLETEAYLFSPADAEAWRSAVRKQNRKSPMTPSQSKRKPKKNPKREKRDRYDTDSYRRAIEYGIKKANKAGQEVPHWYPLQLRHSRATEVRKQFGLEGAQVSMGHAHAAITEVYAEKNLELAMRIAQQTG